MSVHEKKDGRWQVNFRDENGKVRSKTFPAGKEGKKQAKTFDFEVKALKTQGKQLPVVTRQEGIYFDELAQLWLNEKKAQGRAIRWLKEMADLLNKNFIPNLGAKPAHQITQADIMALIGANYANNAQATRNRYIGYVKAIFEHGVEHGHLKKNPLLRWKKGKEAPRRSRLSLDDLRKIQKAAPNHLAWALEVAWNVPCRPGPSDLFALRFDTHVDYDKGGLNVYHTKVKRWAWIPCDDGFMRSVFLRHQVHASGCLIEYKGSPVLKVAKALRTAAKRAGLPYEVCFYDVRHLWITTMLDAGASAAAVAEMAGTSLEMIMANYYEINRSEKDRAVGLLPKLSQEKIQQNKKVVGIDSVTTTKK